MNWQVEWLDEAKKDMRKLGKAEQIQVLKGIEKVRTNPLPTSQGGYGKPLRNAERTKLSGLCKIKFRDMHSSCLQTVTARWNHDHHRRWHSFRQRRLHQSRQETQRIWTIGYVRQFSTNVTFLQD